MKTWEKGEKKNVFNLFHLRSHACWLEQINVRWTTVWLSSSRPAIAVWTKAAARRTETTWANHGHFLRPSMTFNRRYKFKSQTIRDIFSPNCAGSNRLALLTRYGGEKKEEEDWENNRENHMNALIPEFFTKRGAVTTVRDWILINFKVFGTSSILGALCDQKQGHQSLTLWQFRQLMLLYLVSVCSLSH